MTGKKERKGKYKQQFSRQTSLLKQISAVQLANVKTSSAQKLLEDSSIQLPHLQ